VTGLLIALVGIWIFAQVAVGGLAERIGTFVGGGEPSNAGGTASVTTATRNARYRGRTLSVAPTVRRGDQIVYDTVLPACEAAGGGFRIISWYRGPGERTASGTLSCHRFGKRTRKGAVDIIPVDGDWSRCDALVLELRQTPGVGEVIFRGDADHDPALGADDPHVHAAVGCG